jgi:hypothetical protein
MLFSLFIFLLDVDSFRKIPLKNFKENVEFLYFTTERYYIFKVKWYNMIYKISQAW